MNWPIREFPLEELYLDQHNIRTPISVKDQNALIRDMFANERAFDITLSYVQNGVFPDEFPIVVQENRKTIVIEGNRRLAALKALNEPDIVPVWKKRVEALEKPKIRAIRVVVAPNRDAATKHIANKHTIDLRRPWKPLRQAYFYKSQLDSGRTIEELIEEFPEHKIPRFIKMIEMHHLAKAVKVNEAVLPKVHDDRNFPITTLERFYNDNYVGDFLGVEFDDQGRVKGKISQSEFERGYTKLVEDIATGVVDSRKMNSATERRKYIDRLPAQYQPNHSRTGVFGVSDFLVIDVPVLDKKGKRTGRKTPIGLYFQSDVPFGLSSTSLRLLYEELRDISVADFPNATYDLLRSFLECSLVYYLKSTGEYDSVKKNEAHNPKLSEMLTFIVSPNCLSLRDNNIKQAANQIKADWNEPYSLERMNMRNHNENWNSSEREVRSAWGKMEGLFKHILNPPQNK